MGGWQIFFSNNLKIGNPIAKVAIASPIAIHITDNKYGKLYSGATYKETPNALINIGGRGVKYLFGIFHVIIAAIKVKRLPNHMSQAPNPPIIFASSAPTYNPGIKAGSK